MFDVWNSTFGLENLQLFANTPATAVAFIRSSTFVVSRCEITSCADTCPFVIGDSRIESSVSVSIISSNHRSSSESPTLLPLVSGPASFSPSTSDGSDGGDNADTFGVGSVSIVGSGLTVKSQHLVVGTGPLFDFGSFIGSGLCGIVGCSVSLSTSSLTNTTSTLLPPRTAPSCSFLTQRLIGVSVSESTNHLSGTSGVPLDWAGSSLLSNCSFSSCTTTAAPSPIAEPTHSDSDPIQSYLSQTTRITRTQNFNDGNVYNPVWVMSCTFSDLSTNDDGAAIAIFLYRADVVVKDSLFKRCHASGTYSVGGAILVMYNPNSADISKYSFTLYNCVFSNNTATYAGHLHSQYYHPATIAKCTFGDSRSKSASPLNQQSSLRIVLEGDCRLDNCTVSNNEGTIAGGFILLQELSNGSVILTDLLFDDNLCTASTPSERVTDFVFADDCAVENNKFFDCFSTSAQPHCGYIGAEGVLPDLIGPSITSVIQTIQENGDGDGLEVVLSFEGVFTGTSRKYDVTLEDGDGQRVVIEGAAFTKSTGSVTVPVSNPSVPSLSSSTEYKIVDVQKNSSQGASNSLVFEGETEPDWTWWHHTPSSRAGSMVGLSFSTPAGPTLTNIEAELNGSNMNESIVVVTVDRILDGSFTLFVFESSDALQAEISIGPFSFSSSSTPTTSSRTVVIRPSGLLSFGKTYRVKALFSSKLLVSHTAPTFTIPEAPPSIGSFSVERQSNPGLFILILDGLDLPVGAGWTATLSTGLNISGSFVSSTKGESDPLPFRLDGVTFNTTYTVSRVLLVNGTTIILESNTFTTPAPPELLSVRASLDESKESVILVLTGKDVPHGLCSMTLMRSDNNAHLDLSFNCSSNEISPPFSMSSDAQLDYGKTYRIVNMTASGVNVIFLSPLSFVIPAIPSLVNVSLSFERNSIVPVTLTGEIMPDGTYEVGVMKSGTALVVVFTVDFEDNTGLIDVDVSNPFFVREEEYVISSITTLEGDNVRIPNHLTFVIPPVQLDITMYVSAVRGEESQLCGAKSRPCKSVDWAWGIVESLSMNSVSIALLDESELTTSIEQTSGSLRMWFAGPNGMDRLVIPSTASLGERDAMIVIRSSLEMRQLDVLIEVSSPSFVLLSAVNAVVTLKQGSIIGTPSSSRMNADETSELCGWESGAIQLRNSSTSISEMSFRQLSMGAFLIKSGSLVIDTSEFLSNSPHFSSFPSVCRNIHCSDDGSVEVRSLSGGDGTDESVSSWIASSDCTLSSPIINLDSPFFVPSVRRDLSTCTLDKETDTYHVEIHGSTLIPCGLYFEVVGESESGEPKSTKIELLPSIATSFNETFISLDLPSSIVSNLSSSSNEVRGRLIHGNAVATEDLFTFPIRKAWSPGLGTMAWLIPVIVGVVVFLMLVVLIIVCVVCRRRQKKEDEKVSEEEEEECTEKEEDTEDKSDPSLVKQMDEPTETDTLADLIIAPKFNEQFDLKNDDDEQERPHSMKTLEKLTQDPSFEVFVDISGQQTKAEENTAARVNDLDERPVQKKKKKKKRWMETDDEVVAANNDVMMERGEEEKETNGLDETVERPKRKRKKKETQNEVVEGEMEQIEQNLEEEVGKKEKKKKRKKRIEEKDGMEAEREQEEDGEKKTKKKRKKIAYDEDEERQKAMEERMIAEQEEPVERVEDQAEGKDEGKRKKKKNKKGKKDEAERVDEGAKVEEESVMEEGVEEESRAQEVEGKKKRKKKKDADIQEVGENEDTPLLDGEPDTKPKKKKKKNQVILEQLANDSATLDSAI